MRLNIVFILVVLSVGCSSTKDIIGKYSSRKNSNSFEFKRDSTFVFENRSFHLLKWSEGKWMKASEKEIYITSDIKSTLAVANIESSNLSLMQSKNKLLLAVDIKDGTGLANYRCGIYINDVLYDEIRCDSLAEIPISTPIDSFYFHFTKEPDYNKTMAISPPILTQVYYTQKAEGNVLDVSINFDESFFYYQSFNMDVVKVKRKSIAIYNKKTMKWVEIPRVSDDLNIFSSFIN